MSSLSRGNRAARHRRSWSTLSSRRRGLHEVLGIPLLAGTTARAQGSWDSTHTVRVNETFARKYFGSPEAAIGRFVEWSSGDRGEIAAVLGDVRQLGLHKEAAPQVSITWAQAPVRQVVAARFGAEPANGDEVAARQALVTHAIQEHLPGVVVWDQATGGDLIRSSLASRWLRSRLFGLFGLLAALLGALGVHALVAHELAQRNREIAVRMSLGAQFQQIVARLMSHSMVAVLAGLGLGLLGAVLGSRLLESQLFGISRLDPTSFLVAALVLAGAGAVASAIPASRARRVDPLELLRED